ncbi:MAG: hypothetical protein AAGJ46_12425 [Planctomycetota bacterium]
MLALIATLLATGTSQGGLVMTVDAAADTFTLVGSATGVPDGVGLGATTIWDATFGTLNAPPSDQLVADFSFDITSTAGFAFATFTGQEEGDGVSLAFAVISAPGSQTFDVDTSIDYSTASADVQSSIESLIGDEIPLTTGSGFGAITVAAIPEPSIAVTLVMMGITFRCLSSRSR